MARPGDGRGGGCSHQHRFDAGNPVGERRTWWVIALTSAAMVVEITAGWLFGSMALLADGWHMSSHAVALGVTAAAYQLARRLAGDTRFAFGTWKIEVLGGFGSAILLVVVALHMGTESVRRLWHPVAISFDQAIVVAVAGLLVNVASALLLAGHHESAGGGDAHGHAHTHAAHHGDLNLRAAYVHVVADATTSVLAIVALAGGKLAGWLWLDPVMGIVGAVIVCVWAAGLLRDTSRVLLDREMDVPLTAEIRETIEADGVSRVRDLHVWRIGRDRFAAVVTIESAPGYEVRDARTRLAGHEELAHLTVEVHHRRETVQARPTAPPDA